MNKRNAPLKSHNLRIQFHFFLRSEIFGFRKDRYLYVTDYTDMINKMFYIYIVNASMNGIYHTKIRKGHFRQRLAGLIKEDWNWNWRNSHKIDFKWKKNPCKNVQINIRETISSTIEISLIKKLCITSKEKDDKGHLMTQHQPWKWKIKLPFYFNMIRIHRCDNIIFMPVFLKWKMDLVQNH